MQKPSDNRRQQELARAGNQALAKRLTNWQRHQWVKAGRDPNRLEEFLELRRRPA